MKISAISVLRGKVKRAVYGSVSSGVKSASLRCGNYFHHYKKFCRKSGFERVE